jgi:hypothetical protein
MSDKDDKEMLKQNSQMRQKLKMQAQDMGISMSEAKIKWDKKDGYNVEGYKAFKGTNKAVEEGIKEGSLRSRVAARMKKIDDV